MWKRIFSVAVLASTLTLTGCDVFDDDDGGTTLVATTSLRVLHASPDAPAVDVLVDGAPLVSGADYKDGTNFNVVPAGTYTVQVDGLTPGAPTTVIGPVDLDLEANTEYTVIAIGEVANISPYIITAPRTTVSAGSIRATVVHAAPSAPPVSVYVTAPGADLTASAPLGTFSFGDDPLGPVEVPAGDYQIRVTPENTPGTVLFDSGTLTLDEGFDAVIAAVDQTTAGGAPISLIALDGNTSFEILDTDTPTAFRAIHNAPSVGDVDIVIDDGFMQPLVEDLPFAGFTPFVETPAADYNVKVTPANTPGVIAIDADLTLEAGVEYSVYAVETTAGVEAQVLIDDRRSIATQAKVRIVHGSPTAQDVDIYVTAPGTDINGVAPTFAAVPYQAETGYVDLVAGTYTVTVTAAGSKTAAIGPVDITIVNGGVYTAVARDPSGTNPNLDTLGLILLDDFNP